jgi:hypothetical protein
MMKAGVSRLKLLGLTHKHESRLERVARGKHSRLIRISYGRKKFYDVGPG